MARRGANFVVAIKYDASKPAIDVATQLEDAWLSKSLYDGLIRHALDHFHKTEKAFAPVSKSELTVSIHGTSAQLYMPCSSFVRHDSDRVVVSVAFTGKRIPAGGQPFQVVIDDSHSAPNIFDTRLDSVWLAKSLLEGLVAPAMTHYYKREGARQGSSQERVPLGQMQISVDGQRVDVRAPSSMHIRSDGEVPVVKIGIPYTILKGQVAGISGGKATHGASASATQPSARSKPAVGGELWQDNELRFDTSSSQLALRSGEVEIDRLEMVEDTKANTGDKGNLSVTNLRIIWRSNNRMRTNLSIGYKTISKLNTMHIANSKLLGTSQCLQLMTKDNGSDYEFVFTHLNKLSPRLFTTAQAVWRAYDTSRLFREIKLRGAISRDNALIMLPGEQLYSRVEGVWNVASDQGHLGIAYITNVRWVWQCESVPQFNVSAPHVQVTSVKVQNSKFGDALVLTCTKRAGGYTLGFRIDPPERLAAAAHELQSLHAVFGMDGLSPIFGVDFTVEEQAMPLEDRTVPWAQDDVEIVDHSDDAHGGPSAIDVSAAYFANGERRAQEREQTQPVLSTELGLAIEPMPKGVTARMLWNVL